MLKSVLLLKSGNEFSQVSYFQTYIYTFFNMKNINRAVIEFSMNFVPNSYCSRRVFSRVRVPKPMSMAKSHGSSLNQKGTFLVTLIFPSGMVKVKSRLQSIPQQLGGGTQFTMCRIAGGRYFLKSKEIGQSTK
jgi:hypothetical protein